MFARGALTGGALDGIAPNALDDESAAARTAVVRAISPDGWVGAARTAITRP